MGLNQLKKEIELQIVDPAIAKQAGLKSGIIVNAMYETNLDMSSHLNGGSVILEIILYDETGSSSQAVKSVPMIKSPGIQASLPPLGSTAVIAFLDGDVARPICIGIISNYLTNQYTKDHLSPTVPPKNISK